MELGPAVERLRELARLDPGRHGELASSLLARLGPIDDDASAGLPIQSVPPLPIPRTPADIDAVYRFENSCPHGQALPRVLDFFADDPGPHTALAIVEATGVSIESVRSLLRISGKFECVSFQRGQGGQKTWILKGGSDVGSVSAS